MNKRIIVFTITLLSSIYAYPLTKGNDSLFVSAPKSLLQPKTISDDILQYGFKLGTDLSLSSKQLSEFDHLNGLFSGTFGFFIRSGYKYIYGELGFYYMFFKGRYDAYSIINTEFSGTETVESRYIQIPIKIVGQVDIKKRIYFLPNIGIIYQPLIHTSKNDILYGKSNLTCNQFLFNAGLGLRIKFITIDLAFKQSLKPFFSDRPSIKPSFFNIMLGFQF